MLAKIIKATFKEHNAPLDGTVYSDPTTNHLYELFQTDKSILWVALINNQIAGCCGIYPTQGLPPQHAELVKFYLSKEARGQGIGKKLLLKSLDSAKDMGYKTIYLESLPHFSQAVSLYERHGFKRLNQPLGQSGHDSCNIWMIKEI
ncbi:MAG: GNAT family N-acetyltransferase [Odoribacter sp.]|nr:GNAT family N-acetyltransferase [Odoribacter sp.]